MFDGKYTRNEDAKEQCFCSSTQGLFMHNRQVSILISALVLFSFFLFMGGYFLGQKNAATTFSNKIDQESFGDQIYSSMCSLCDSGDIEEDSSENEETDTADNPSSNLSIDQTGDAHSSENNVNKSDIQTAQIAEQSAVQPEVLSSLSNENNQDDGVVAEYFAQLAGFGTARAAQQFAQRLARKEIAVVVKKRQSRSARGKFVSWYQVVTEKFDDKVELEKLVHRLEQEEKLKDVRIVTC